MLLRRSSAAGLVPTARRAPVSRGRLLPSGVCHVRRAPFDSRTRRVIVPRSSDSLATSTARRSATGTAVSSLGHRSRRDHDVAALRGASWDGGWNGLGPGKAPDSAPDHLRTRDAATRRQNHDHPTTADRDEHVQAHQRSGRRHRDPGTDAQEQRRHNNHPSTRTATPASRIGLGTPPRRNRRAHDCRGSRSTGSCECWARRHR